jgi:hypothetical protein
LMTLQTAIDAAYRANEQKLAAQVQIPAHALNVEDELLVNRFGQWCKANGVHGPIGARPTTCAAYLSGLSDDFFEAAEAIRHAHQLHQQPCPISTDAVRTVLGGKLDVEPPRSWNAHEKLMWAELPPEIRRIITHRENERDTALKRKFNELTELKRQETAPASKPVATEANHHVHS